MVTMHSIGVIHTLYPHSEVTPIQGAVANGDVDVVDLFPEFGCFDVKRVGWYAGKSAKDVVADHRFKVSKPPYHAR